MYVAGIDLGATNLRAAVCDGSGDQLESVHRETPVRDGRAIEKAVVETLASAAGAAGLNLTDLTFVGIASIGPLDRAAGAVIDPPNVPAERIEIAAAVRDATGCPVTLINDATAGVLAERRFADAPSNAVYLTLSSGIGAGAVVDGHLLAGHRGNAAEVGHIVVQPDGRRCGCGGRGHWEAYCSGTAIPGLATALAADEETTLSLASLTAAEVFTAAAGDDPLASAVVEQVGAYNAIGVAAVVHAYAPERVSVGGAVALHNREAVLDPIRKQLPDHLAVPAPTVQVTPLGNDAVLRGAVASALRNHNG